uniref:Uncharacterized protein n=1 Tax=Rhizophora mucronata TaxID=61149 RepID=A0A2P2QJ69_RHIMU
MVVGLSIQYNNPFKINQSVAVNWSSSLSLSVF